MEDKKLKRLTRKKYEIIFGNTDFGVFSLDEIVEIALYELPLLKTNAPAVWFEGCFYHTNSQNVPEMVIKRKIIDKNYQSTTPLADKAYETLTLYQIDKHVFSADTDFENLINEKLNELKSYLNND